MPAQCCGRDYISQADESGLIAQIAYTYVPVGGSILYLVGNAFFVKAIGGPWLLSHFVGILALGVIFLAHDSLPSLTTYWIGNGVLVAVLIADEWGPRRREHRPEDDVV
ncbi:MAG: hypothetical protein ABIW36_14275 [Terrimesophilobacter sp.]